MLKKNKSTQKISAEIFITIIHLPSCHSHQSKDKNYSLIQKKIDLKIKAIIVKDIILLERFS